MRFIAPRVAFRRFLVASLAVCGMALVVSCGDEASDKSPVQVAEESSSSVDEVLSSSVNVEESSSSVESEGLSSSVESGASSSSEKSTESSSGKNTEPAEVSSCSVAEGSSSSTTVEPSSSSVKAEQSSSSEKAEASSSSVKVQESSSSEKNDVSSSSEKPVESSSSEKGVESSSSEKSSSSAAIPSKLYDCEIYKCVTTKYLNPDIEYGEYLDVRDSQVYRTVQIGEQVWMAQNLNWNTKGSYCLANDSLNCKSKGHMYPWSIAQSACPDGWHLPDTADFAYLKFYVKQNNGGIGVGTSLKKGANDIFGFSSLVNGGYQTGSNGQFSESDKMFYWTNSEDADNKIYAHVRYLKNSSENLCYETFRKTWSLSVRCIKD
ncbi:MAG: hypothetical protein J5977_07040 [Fibrobacter sp.]|nr:hypothetical protein [Fibrobacter sp.]